MLGGALLHEWESCRQNDRRAVRFIAHGTKTDWFAGAGQQNDWARVMMTALSLTAWEYGSDVKKRPAATQKIRQINE